MLGLLALLLAACSSQGVSTSDSSRTSAPGTSVAGTTPKGTTVAVVCTETVLEVLTAEEIPSSTVDDVTCGPTGTDEAVATIIKQGTPDEVAFFVGADDGWRLEAHAGVATPPEKIVPKDFSMSLYRTWRDKYDLRMNPAVTKAPRPSKAPGTSTPSGGAWCNRVGDKVVCKDPRPTTTTTTAPKPTTTTTRPTTTVAPVTVTTAPAPKPPSPFCLANPFDPRCAADPSFPG